MFTIVYSLRIHIKKKEYLLNPSYYIFHLSNTFKNRVTVSLACFYAFQNLARILSSDTKDGRLPYRDHTLLLPSLRAIDARDLYIYVCTMARSMEARLVQTLGLYVRSL